MKSGGQLSIIHYQLSISELCSLCHATPKINFYHLKNGYFAQVIHPKMRISSDFTNFPKSNGGHPHGQPPYFLDITIYMKCYLITSFGQLFL